MQRVVVTGATGLVGAKLILRLLAQNFEVAACYRREERKDLVQKWLNQQAIPCQMLSWYKVDISDLVSLEGIIRKGDFVVHCAAFVRLIPGKEKSIYETNVEGTRNILLKAGQAGVKWFCHLSSAAVLGEADEADDLITELSPFKRKNTQTVYAQSKFVAETEAWRASEEGLKLLSILPSVIIGHGPANKQWPEIIRWLRKRKKMPVPAGSTGWVLADDVVQFILLAMQQQLIGHRVLLNAENLSYQHLASIARNTTDVKIITPIWLIAGGRISDILNKLGLKIPFGKKQAYMLNQQIAFDGSKATKLINEFKYSNVKAYFRQVDLGV